MNLWDKMVSSVLKKYDEKKLNEEEYISKMKNSTKQLKALFNENNYKIIDPSVIKRIKDEGYLVYQYACKNSKPFAVTISNNVAIEAKKYKELYEKIDIYVFKYN